MAIRCVSHEDDPGQLAVAHGQLFVDPQRGIFVSHGIRARSFLAEIPRGEDVHSHDFQLRRLNGAAVNWSAISSNRRSQDFSLFE